MIDTLATGIGLFGFVAIIGLFGWMITNGRKKRHCVLRLARLVVGATLLLVEDLPFRAREAAFPGR